MISTRGRYALRVMEDLAENGHGGYVPLHEIAERQQISEKYLEAILRGLVQNGLLRGLRGRHGGYRLTRRPDEYPIGEILNLTEGTIAPVACLREGADECPLASECRTRPMWTELDDLLNDFFYGKTLADLMPPEIWEGYDEAAKHVYIPPRGAINID